MRLNAAQHDTEETLVRATSATTSTATATAAAAAIRARLRGRLGFAAITTRDPTPTMGLFARAFSEAHHWLSCSSVGMSHNLSWKKGALVNSSRSTSMLTPEPVLYLS